MITDDALYLFISIAIMTVITYLMRAIPLLVFHRKIKSRFFRSFLYYVPYAVLSAMAFPSILEATGNTAASIVGTAVAVVLAFFRRSLIIVAFGAAVAAYLVMIIF